jgi:hypothetical protein
VEFPNLVHPRAGSGLTQVRGHRLILSTQGNGPSAVKLQQLTTGPRFLIRIVCNDPAGFVIDNAAHALVVRGGCDPAAVYSAELRASALDSSLLVGTGGRWAIAVWQR